MKNEHLMPVEISIKEKQKTVKGRVVRAAMAASSKVIHVLTSENENYYLIYYRNFLIYGDKIDGKGDQTFIEKAFLNGIVLEATHPLLPVFVPKQSISLPNRNKLFSQLQSHFSPQEIAYIATTLDSFYEKEYLIKIIERLYFDYKRSGKFMKSFQILQILSDFMPFLKSANERLASREFYTSQTFYESSSISSIYEKDPLYAELYCFKNHFHPDIYLFYEEILRKKECFVEILMLWLEKTEKMKKAEAIEKYTSLALKMVNMQTWISSLAFVKINPFRVLPEAKQMIEKMVDGGEYETAALSLLDFIDDLPGEYYPILIRIWGNLHAEFVVGHLENFIQVLEKQGLNGNQKQSESQIFQLVVAMLKGYDLQSVHDKLLPLQKVLPHSNVLRKLSRMVSLLENPDRMMELGDDYAEFQQYDSAIDCYFWEMELKPKDPDPVWKLCKMYQHKGMLTEAAAYQKVFAELKNVQELG